MKRCRRALELIKSDVPILLIVDELKELLSLFLTTFVCVAEQFAIEMPFLILKNIKLVGDVKQLVVIKSFKRCVLVWS